jgi:3-dehydroquinate synthase
MSKLPDHEVDESRLRIFIYGPPGSGKSRAGRRLAEDLALPFRDVDEEVESASGESIPGIFELHGEAEFRKRERNAIENVIARGSGVISLGGGALLDPHSRALVERSGWVGCLVAPLEVLLERLSNSAEERPLLEGDLRSQLERLLEGRKEHYASFPLQIDTAQLSPKEASWELQVRMGVFHVRGMGPGYDVRVGTGGLHDLGREMILGGLRGPVMVVSDENVAPLYARGTMQALEEAGIEPHLAVIRAGESSKKIDTVKDLWEAFTAAGLERGSSVVALGGGVVGDLAGFAAATYLRGITWTAVPTTLLAMVDASLGGKTGFDLPSGKNLVGAFHPPQLVLADVRTLDTLPEDELGGGMAEVVKHGLIGDPELFALCAEGWGAVRVDLDSVVRQAMAVKVRVIQDDPYEQGERAALNLGHTLGHALEHASDYRIRHGAAVAIGMVAAARLSERMGIAEDGLSVTIAEALLRLGLPTDIPSQLDRARIVRSMGVDKKRLMGRIRFVLPVRIGEVRTGVVVDDPAVILVGEL